MARNNQGIIMDNLIHKSCKIRKRGCSSSSSTSSKFQNYRFKRAILVGNNRREVGSRSSTPVPTWKTTSGRGGGAESPKYESSKSRPVSARKLAATLWEMNDMPKVIMDQNKTKLFKGRDKVRNSLPPHLSDPSHTPLFEGMDRSAAGSIQRRTPSVSQKHRLAGKTVLAMDSLSSGSLVEVMIEPRSRGQTPSRSIVGDRNRLKDVGNALSTSRELLKVIIRIWSHNDSPTSSTSLVSALHSELERARLQVNQIIKEQQVDHNEIDYFVKCFAEEKASWKNRQQQAIEAAVNSIAGELAVERKLRRRFESLNKKLGKELAETKSSFMKAVKDLESEKRAREILEQVCDELASDIGKDRAAVEVLKRESAKVHEEVEREREMLQLADKLREERVQMKLSEAKHHFEEKNAVMDKLRNQLEAFLRPKTTKKKDSNSRTLLEDDDKTTYLSRTHFEANEGNEDDGEVENEVDNDEDSAESDLHSIELNMDKNNKSFKWSHAAAAARESRRVSVDGIRGRSSISGEIPKKDTSIQRSRSDGVEWGIHSENIQNEVEVLDLERFHALDKHVQRKSYWDEMERFKSVKGLRDQTLSSCRIGSARDFPSPNRDWAQPRFSQESDHVDQERPHVVHGSGSKSRLGEPRGEGLARRSKR